MNDRESSSLEMEPKEYSSRIVLSFRRHGDKKKLKEGQIDAEIELTAKGREQAMASANPDVSMDQAVAFGSPRVRSQQTAGYEMGGSLEEITGNENYEELKTKLNSGLKYGSKLGTDVRLDFPEQPGSAYVKEVRQSFADGHPLTYLVNDSDRRAAELGDNVSYTYGREAAGIAQILEKYLKVAPQWEQLYKNERTEQTGTYSDTLERYMGTHASVGESFLAKLLEVTKGTEERDRFVEALGGKSFDVAEGFAVEIRNHGAGEPSLHVTYRKENKDSNKPPYIFDEDIPLEAINKIAAGA